MRHLPTRGHLPALDGLRAIAILSVMLFHYTSQPENTPLAVAFTTVARSGWAGVDLFFVLSGFLITRILVAAKGAPAYFRNFYARRALRIFPLFYAYLVAVTIVLPLLLPGDADVAYYAADAGWHWLYLSNVLPIVRGGLGANGHLWSLAIEEQFYLVWPLLVMLLSSRALLRACITLIAAALILRVMLALFASEPLLFMYLLPARMDALAVGALLAVVAAMPGGFDRLRRSAPLALAATGVALLLMSVPTGRLAFLTFPQATAGYLLVAVFCAALIVLSLAAPAESWLPRMLNSRVLSAIGKYSYCMYVVHVIAGDLTRRVLSDLRLPVIAPGGLAADVVAIMLGSVVTFGIAWVSWRIWERPWLRLKSHFEHTAVPAAANVVAIGGRESVQAG